MMTNRPENSTAVQGETKKSIFDEGQRRVPGLGAVDVFFGVTAHSMLHLPVGVLRPSTVFARPD